MHDGDGALGEDAEAPRVGDEGGGVGDPVARVELVRGEAAEGAPLVGLRDRVHHLAAASCRAS